MLSSNRTVVLGAAALVALTAACGNSQAPTDCSESPFSESALVAASEQDTAQTWRERIDSLVANAPGDSVVSAGIIYVSWPTDEDRELLRLVDATIVYEFISFAGLVVSVPVRGLSAIAGSERVQHMGVASESLMPMTRGC
jgi:hypothetical protein